MYVRLGPLAKASGRPGRALAQARLCVENPAMNTALRVQVRERGGAEQTLVGALGGGPWLLIAPHDDDIILGAGLLLLAAQAQGIAVHVAVATDGSLGYARPEGYRKALRAMRLAEKFRRAIVVFVDTPAAYPGIDSEERGVAEAIAANLREMMMIDTPIVVLVSGEGGSGGALGIAVGDKILMQEYAIYSVIPPEGCAAILWRDANRKADAAAALKITAPDLLAARIIDIVVREPVGGAPRRTS